jgi:(hydroxyamino)benzene mutase
MTASDWRRRQGNRLLQVGMVLFLLALLVGLMVPAFAAPRLGLSTHLLGITQSLFLLAIGVLWPRLRFSRAVGRLGVFLAIFGCWVAWTANLLGAIWGAGSSMLPMAAGSAYGTAMQETVISVALRSAAVALIAVTLLIIWGLRDSVQGAEQAASD